MNLSDDELLRAVAAYPVRTPEIKIGEIAITLLAWSLIWISLTTPSRGSEII
jgi:hypothetical protein